MSDRFTWSEGDVQLEPPVEPILCRVRDTECQLLGGTWSVPDEEALERRLQRLTDPSMFGSEEPDRDHATAVHVMSLVGGQVISSPREMQPFGKDAVY